MKTTRFSDSKGMNTVMAPPTRLLTVGQTQIFHPGTEGRIRSWIVRADRGDPDLAWLKPAVVRVGRSVFISEAEFLDGLKTRTGAAPEKARNPYGCVGSKRR